MKPLTLALATALLFVTINDYQTHKRNKANDEAASQLEYVSGIVSNGKEPASDAAYYRINRVSEGEVGVTCMNHGDPTIEPTQEFGYLVVSCGTR